MSNHQYICPECGSNTVLHDAWAVYDIEAQDYVVHSVHDAGYCEGCEKEVTPQLTSLDDFDEL